MNGAARRLQACMTDICRRAYGEAWMDHLEFALWHAVVSGEMRYGRVLLDDGVRAELRQLSDACGGWIHLGSDGEFHCVQLAEWQDLYTNNVDLVHMNEPVPPPDPFGGPS